MLTIDHLARFLYIAFFNPLIATAILLAHYGPIYFPAIQPFLQVHGLASSSASSSSSTSDTQLLVLDILALLTLTYHTHAYLDVAWRNQLFPFSFFFFPPSSSSHTAKPGTKEWWTNQTILITGGAGGLGAELVTLCRAKGAKVVSLDVQHEISAEGYAKGKGKGGKQEEEQEGCLAIKVDLRDSKSLGSIKEVVHDRLGPVSIIINNAGMHSGQSKSLVEGTLSPPLTDLLIDINLKSQFHVLHTFLPDLIARGKEGGHVVSVASIMGYVGIARVSDYVASKHGVVGLHASLRQELDSIPLPPPPSSTVGEEEPYARHNIRTTLVTLGRLSTPLFAKMQAPSTSYKAVIANFLSPTVDAKLVAQHIVERALAPHRSVEINLPLYAKIVPAFKLMPSWMQDLAHFLVDANKAMS